MPKGYFFSIEGCEGAGKSSLITKLSEYLRTHGHDVITTREPGGIAIAEQIRSVILDKLNTAMDGRTEALLYAAARRQHYVEKIAPSVTAGHIIICDRFIDSSLAYQGYARGLGIDEVLAINEFAIEKVFPDLTIYLDVDPEVGLKRIHEHGNREINRLDLEALTFHQRVREGYLQLLGRFPERIVNINANLNENEVFEEVRQVVDRFLNVEKV
jgi:dTMP kinase